MGIITIIKRIIPKTLIDCMRSVEQRLRARISVAAAYKYDFQRYLRYSSTIQSQDEIQLAAQITARAHTLEKGLAMSVPRPGFGKETAKALSDLLCIYSQRYDINESVLVQSALKVLNEYFQYHRQKGIEFDSIESLLGQFDLSTCISGGAAVVSRDCILDCTKGSFEELVSYRHSIRCFTDEHVDPSIIKKAVRIAQKSPSSCNRQPARVYAAQTPSNIRDVLSLLTGHKGFGESIGGLLLIAADLRIYCGARERNQAYLEGGLFAMSLIYALHSMGLGTCVLNCSITQEKDKALRSVLQLDEAHTPIVFIAIGHLPPEIKLTHSQRLNLDDVIFFR